MEEAKKLAASMGVTVEALLSGDDRNLCNADVAPKYVRGEPLPRDKKFLDNLPTNMRKLHDWYLDEAKVKGGTEAIVLKVPPEYFFREEEVHVMFEDLFDLYNLDALDKSFITCYCL
jgi:hypothetical protein